MFTSFVHDLENYISTCRIQLHGLRKELIWCGWKTHFKDTQLPNYTYTRSNLCSKSEVIGILAAATIKLYLKWSKTATFRQFGKVCKDFRRFSSLSWNMFHLTIAIEDISRLKYSKYLSTTNMQIANAERNAILNSIHPISHPHVRPLTCMHFAIENSIYENIYPVLSSRRGSDRNYL